MANTLNDDRRLFSPSTAHNRESIHAILAAFIALAVFHEGIDLEQVL